MDYNLTLHKLTIASSSVYPYLPERVTNGAMDGHMDRWLTTSLPADLTVNLGGPCCIMKWSVYSIESLGWNNRYNMKGYTLQCSLDGVNWWDADSVADNRAKYTTLPLKNITACFVRLHINKGSGMFLHPDYASIAGFEVWGERPTSPYLKALAISAGPLDPPFKRGTGHYNCTLPFEAKTITIMAVPEDPDAKIEINRVAVTNGQASQEIPLVVGNNTNMIQVTPRLGWPLTYTVNVTRQDSTLLTDLIVKNQSGAVVSITPTFAKGPLSYTANVSSDVESITLTPVKEGVNATITVDGQPVASGAQSQSVSLTAGITKAVNVVVSVSGVPTTTYVVQVTRPASNNLTSLAVMNGTTNIPLTPTFTSETTAYTASAVDNSVTLVNVIPTAQDSSATLKVNGTIVQSGGSLSVPISEGLNNITVEVNALGAATKTYTVGVTRATSAYLKSVTGIPGVNFVKTTCEYTTGVTTTKVKPTIIPEDTSAAIQVSVNGINVPYTQTISFTPDTGLNEMIIKVNSSIGGDSKTYAFHITKS